MVDIEEPTEEKLKKILFELVPDDGSTIGNVTLLREFKKEVNKQCKRKVKEDAYWEIRNVLIDDGKLSTGRGKGGSVYRTEDVKSISKPQLQKKKAKKKKEQELYRPFHGVIKTSWVKSKNMDRFVLSITANQGSSGTGGKWTRPDVSLVHVQTLSFYPDKILDVITFEIKTEDNWGIEGVYETASHSIFANKAYYAIYLPKGEPKEELSGGAELELFGRVKKECERFKIGLMIFSNPGDWKTYETLIEPERRIPDPEEISNFISKQFSGKDKDAITMFLK